MTNPDKLTQQAEPQDRDQGEIELRGWTFAQVPKALIRDKHLSHGAVRLFCAIYAYADEEKHAWPGQLRLADDLGLEGNDASKTRSVRRFLKELTDAGWVTIKRRGRAKTNLYTLHAVPVPRADDDRTNMSAQADDRTPVPGQDADDRTNMSAQNPMTGQMRPVNDPMTGLSCPPNDNQTPLNENQKEENENQQQEQPARVRAAPAAAPPGPCEALFALYDSEGIKPALTPRLRARLRAWVADGLTPAEFEHALGEAVAHDAGKFAYVAAVVERLLAEKVPAHNGGANGDSAENVQVPETPHPAPEGATLPNIVTRPLCEVIPGAWNHSLATIWKAVLGQLRVQLNQSTFDLWLRGSEVVGLDGRTAVIAVRNAYARDWLTERLAPTVAQALSKGANVELAVRFVAPGEGAPGENGDSPARTCTHVRAGAHSEA